MYRPLICLAILAVHFAGPLRAENTLIAPSDVLGLRVTDWLPIDGELREWVAITGVYTVGADGRAAFPYIGEIVVAGQSPSSVGDQISEALKQRFALADRPNANVSIDARRPVLVGGAVQQPGEVPYVAQMTARHAIALAGGILRPSGSESSVMVQSLTAEAQVRILTDQEAAGALRVARLRAELEGAAEMAPDSLPTVSGPTVASLMSDAARLLTLQNERLQRDLGLTDSRIALLDEEIITLAAKQDALDRQRLLAEEQKANTASLAERGLMANARLLDAERTLVTVETQVLDVATALLQARQSLEVAKADRVQLVQDHAADIIAELQIAEVELAELREKLLLQQSVAAFLAASLGGEGDADALSVVVYRSGSDNPEVLRNGLETVLEPGDLVEVTLAIASVPNGG